VNRLGQGAHALVAIAWPPRSPGLWIGLGVSAAIGSVAYGGLLMLAFAIGIVIPLAVGTISIGWLESLQAVER
jgi:cytochrome c-type biogenesis protein